MEEWETEKMKEQVLSLLEDFPQVAHEPLVRFMELCFNIESHCKHDYKAPLRNAACDARHHLQHVIVVHDLDKKTAYLEEMRDDCRRHTESDDAVLSNFGHAGEKFALSMIAYIKPHTEAASEPYFYGLYQKSGAFEELSRQFKDFMSGEENNHYLHMHELAGTVQTIGIRLCMKKFAAALELIKDAKEKMLLHIEDMPQAARIYSFLAVTEYLIENRIQNRLVGV